jgi:hypothetical protein
LLQGLVDMSGSGPKTLADHDASGAVCESACEPAPIPSPNGGAAPGAVRRNGGARSGGTAGTATVAPTTTAGNGSGLMAEPPSVRRTTAGQGRLVADPAPDYIAPSLHRLAVPIDALRPMVGNARQHGERDLSAIAASLQAHGQQRPVVAMRRYRGVPAVIIAGCGTWTAAKRLGWRYIAVTWFEGSDDEAAAYSVRDNRTAELSAWSADALTALADDGLDLRALWADDVGLAALLDAPVSAADWSAAFAKLPTEDRESIRQMTFTVSDRQAEVVRRALAAAKALGPFEDEDSENSNGCALHRIAAAYLEART